MQESDEVEHAVHHANGGVGGGVVGEGNERRLVRAPHLGQHVVDAVVLRAPHNVSDLIELRVQELGDGEEGAGRLPDPLLDLERASEARLSSA